MITLPRDKLPRIPRSVSVCPICDADLVIADIDVWEIHNDGSESVCEEGLTIGCSMEPEMDKGGKWLDGHYPASAMDEWWDATASVLKWLNSNYRFVESGQEQLEKLRAWNSGQARRVTP